MRTIRIIKNETRYRSRNLITLFARVHKDYLTKFNEPSTVRVRIKYQRGEHGRLGYAYYNNNLIEMRLRRDGVLDVPQIASTFQHELDHCRGVRHSDMGECNRHRWVNGKEQWHKDRELPDVSDIAIGIKAQTKKAKAMPNDKLESIRLRLKAWNTKKKRAETAITKLTKKLRYYERKLGSSERQLQLPRNDGDC